MITTEIPFKYDVDEVETRKVAVRVYKGNGFRDVTPK